MNRKILYPILVGAGLSVVDANAAALDSTNVRPINDSLPYFTQVDSLPLDVVLAVARKDFPKNNVYAIGENIGFKLKSEATRGNVPRRQARYIEGAFGYESYGRLAQSVYGDLIDEDESLILRTAVANHLKKVAGKRHIDFRSLGAKDLELRLGENGVLKYFVSKVPLGYLFEDTEDGERRVMEVNFDGLYEASGESAIEPVIFPFEFVHNYAIQQLRGKHAAILYPKAVELALRYRNLMVLLEENQGRDTVTVHVNDTPVKLPRFEVGVGGDNGRFASVSGTYWLNKNQIGVIGSIGSVGYKFGESSEEFTKDVFGNANANVYARDQLKRTITQGAEGFLGIGYRTKDGLTANVQGGVVTINSEETGNRIETSILNRISRDNITPLNGGKPVYGTETHPAVKAGVGYSKYAGDRVSLGFGANLTYVKGESPRIGIEARVGR